MYVSIYVPNNSPFSLLRMLPPSIRTWRPFHGPNWPHPAGLPDWPNALLLTIEKFPHQGWQVRKEILGNIEIKAVHIRPTLYSSNLGFYHFKATILTLFFKVISFWGESRSARAFNIVVAISWFWLAPFFRKNIFSYGKERSLCSLCSFLGNDLPFFSFFSRIFGRYCTVVVRMQ